MADITTDVPDWGEVARTIQEYNDRKKRMIEAGGRMVWMSGEAGNYFSVILSAEHARHLEAWLIGSGVLSVAPGVLPESVEMQSVIHDLANRSPMRGGGDGHPERVRCRLCFQPPGQHLPRCIWARAYRIVHPGQALPY